MSEARFERRIASPGCRICKKCHPYECHLYERHLWTCYRPVVAENAMRPANSSTASWLVAAAFAAVMAVSAGGLAAQSAPDGENGRYSLSPTPEGVLGLDSRPGTVSTCPRSGAGWACYAVPDERTALDAEIGRLQAEVETLKGRLAAGAALAGKNDTGRPQKHP